MKEIVSLTNSEVKKIASLKQKKVRDELGLAVIEGQKFVAEALKKGVVDKLVFTKKFLDNQIAATNNANIEKMLVSSAVFKKISDEQTAQEILAIIKTGRSSFKLPTSNFLVLDNVSDPGNLGAILRVAAATGFGEIYCLGGADIYNPKVLRSAAGNIFKLKIYNISLEKLEAISDKCILLCGETNGKNLFELSKVSEKPVGLVFGNEGRGVCAQVRNHCDYSFSIPMKNGVESLNVATSAAVACYHFFNKF